MSDEVEKKVDQLVNDTFTQFNVSLQDEEPALTKDQAKEFIMGIMNEAGEADAFDEKEFDKCYKQFDRDGEGTISKTEFRELIKKFAKL